MRAAFLSRTPPPFDTINEANLFKTLNRSAQHHLLSFDTSRLCAFLACAHQQYIEEAENGDLLSVGTGLAFHSCCCVPSAAVRYSTSLQRPWKMGLSSLCPPRSRRPLTCAHRCLL